MILAGSHAVLATSDVPRILKIFSELFSLKPHFENEMFGEFVLPSRYRLAFFKPVGKASQFFREVPPSDRGGVALGLTVEDVDAVFQRATEQKLQTSGPPKEHPWGEKSFLLVDPDGNRWEITQSPSQDGMLVNRP